MTTLSDLEISKRLALAIGHDPYYVTELVITEELVVYDHALEVFRNFDYRDWNVIGPIAKRYNMFPYCLSGKWWDVAGYGCPVSDTPQKAIALAVIGAKR